MVSTRGGARTGADDPQESELSLRKKPVRKTATKKATKEAPTAKTTRAKKTEPENDDEEDIDELQGDDQQIVSAPKVTRKGRAKKDEPTAATVQSKSASTSRARTAASATISKAGATTRTTKPSKLESADTPDLAPPTQAKAKPARATRATASTRATAAKEKVPPLSPRKITQVSKAPERSTRTTTKEVTAKGEGKSAIEGRPTTRRRVASDENAGVPKYRPTSADRRGEQDVKVKQNLKDTSAVEKLKSQPGFEAQAAQTPVSSRPTTPTQLDDESDGMNEPGSKRNTALEVGGAVEVSGDELCGPKTPMKRLSPRERVKHVSVQKNARSDDIPMRTPVRRLLVLGSHGGTPQTQQPYRKPSYPTSEVRPTTVARARDRAMVFPQLQPLVIPQEVDEVEETDNDETTTSAHGENDPIEVDESDLSISTVDFLEQQSEPDEKDDQRRDVLTTSNGKPEQVENDDINNGSTSDVDHVMRDTVAIPFQMEHISIAHNDDENAVQTAPVELEDPNETILMDQEMGADFILQEDASLESVEDVTRQSVIAEVDEQVESMEDIRLTATTPRPETIVWENLREDVTIPFNFDDKLTSSRGFTSGELNSSTNLDSESDVEPQSGFEASVSLLDQPCSNDGNITMALADVQYQRQSFGDVRLSIDATVNLSDFLDVSSLAEQSNQTGPLPIPTQDEEIALGQEQAQTDDDEVASQHEVAAVPHDIPDGTPSTPARETGPALSNGSQHEPQHSHEPRTPRTPHYAMPTIAFRRKSLPAIIYHTPIRDGDRPKTSDGHSIARIAKPFVVMSSAQGKSQQETTPFRGRPGTASGRATVSRSQTPSASRQARSTSRTPRVIGQASFRQTPRTSGRLSARPTPKERFPGLPSRQTYEELASTPIAKTPGRPMPSAAKSNTKERFPAMPPAERYEDFSKTPEHPSPTTKESMASPAEKASTPQIEAGDIMPQQEERYPGLPHRRTYEEHARTAMPPSRFRTPTQSPAKRPATVQKPASLRKVALRGSHTPIRTPIRAAAMTPGQIPLTPHPGAPLRGVNAYVDVFLNDGSSANSTYIAVLHSLGAKTTKTFNDRVTHVIFKEGSPATLQRLRLHNKQVSDSSKGHTIFCVNGRWVNDSNSEGARMDETDEAYSVDIDDQRATKRRRKSMEPTSLLNIGGNVVRDTGRKSSLGRSSLGRALKADSLTVSSPSMEVPIDIAEKENSGDSSIGDGSPMTPAYLAAPDSLVQQTAPINRMRKLDFDTQEQAKSRRLTFWNGGEF